MAGTQRINETLNNQPRSKLQGIHFTGFPACPPTAGKPAGRPIKKFADALSCFLKSIFELGFLLTGKGCYD
jgi:hypothetical protein